MSTQGRITRRVCWSQCEIQAQGWIRRVSTISSMPSIQPSLKAWAWGWPSAARLSRPTAGDCGRPPTSTEAQPFSLHYPLTLRGCHDQSEPVYLITKRKSYQSRRRIVANTLRPALEGQDGINGEEAKTKILSLTVVHYPVSTSLNLSVSSIASVPTQNGATTKDLEED